MYNTERFQQKHIFKLIVYLKEYNLDDAMPEFFKLCALILRIQYSTAPVERTFSLLNRVKSALRNSTTEERLSSLIILAFEKEKLREMMQNDLVIEKFCLKNRRIDLTYQ